MTAHARGQARGAHRRDRRPLRAITLVLVAGIAVGGLGVTWVLGAAGASAGKASMPGGNRPAGTGPAAARPAGAPAAAGSCPARRGGVRADLVPACGAWWGMYLPAADGDLVRTVRAEERYLGRRLAIIERYHDMSASSDGIFPDRPERRLARHHLLLFSWAPNVWSRGTRYPWAAVASGALDKSVIIPEARRLRAFHHRFFLTFAAEADGVSGQGTPAQFIAAWRHIHKVFGRLGVRRAVWVWITEGYLPHARQIAALYPGNAYVDWIGYDPYNFFSCHHAKWLSFPEVISPFYRWLTAHGLGGKPLMLAEFGSAADASDPGREAAWYSSIAPALPGFPRIKALIQWNAAAGSCDLRLAHGSAAGKAYRKTGLSGYLTRENP